MTTHFTKEKLAREPKGTVRFRRKKVDSHVMTFAVRPPGEFGPRGGKTVATSVLHPKGESRGFASRLRRAADTGRARA